MTTTSPPTTTTTLSTCQLGNGIKHVIHITFDNVHFTRDNPNVLSDLEQIPALVDFIESNGTMLSNHHTPLIAHTGDDLLTQYSGVYGDRHGMGISNNYEYYNGTAVTSADSFVYWTSPIIDHATQQPSSTDLNPSMVYSAQVPPVAIPSATTGHDAMTPAPWAPFTKAGCDVATVSTANMVLEKFADIPTVFGPGSPEAQQLAADTDGFKDAEVDDYIGVSLHCGQVGGVNSPLCANAQAVKFNQTTPSPSATVDLLPDEPGGYDNFLALHGIRYLAPVIGGGPNVSHNGFQVTDAAGNLVDLNGQTIVGGFQDLHPGQTGSPRFNPGFPGFSPTAAESLAYVADMLEAGVPVVYGYISDVHDKKFPNGSTTRQSGCSSPGNALGPGDPCYKQSLADYNAAFIAFFARLAANGIDPSNTLFIFSAEEQDHYAGANAGRALQPTCTGTPGTLGYTCTYDATNAPVGEVALNIHGLISNQQGDTTPFYSEPQGVSIYVTGGQSPDTIRQLQRHFSAAVANDAYDANPTTPVVAYMADPLAEQLLHFTNADPNRTPSFTVFPRGDYFFSSGMTDSCGSGVTADNANLKCSSINSGFAWNHGYYAPEIDITWLGMVGPGVANHGLDGPPASIVRDGSQTVPDESTVGTWSDHADIRPTMFALLGLQDSHVDDGRVLSEVLSVTPGQTADPRYQPLAACYKQLNSCVGRFATAVLVGDTRALASGTPSDDSQYESFSANLATLGTQRDALATTIKMDLAAAASGSGLSADADSELQECNALIEEAESLAASQPTTTTTTTLATTTTTAAPTTTTAPATTTTLPTTSSSTTTTLAPQCQLPTDCPGSDTECATRTCSAGVCGVSDAAAGTACTDGDASACDGHGTCSVVVSVVRVGDGTTALSSGVAAPVFVEQHLLSGELLGSPIALPVAPSGANQALTLSGTASSEGALWRSVDGHFLSLAGYDAAPGTMGVVNSASASTNRVVARIDATGSVDTTTRINAGFSGNNVRGAASVDGSAFWLSGTAGSGSPAGIFYIPFGTTGGIQILSSPNNTRVVEIFDGQLYASAASGTFVNVFTVGSGLPTTSGQTAMSLPGMPTSAGPSPYAFALLDRDPNVPGPDLLYLADDRSPPNGGIQKWTFDGTTWTLATTLNAGSSGARGLTAFVTGANVTLVATTGEATQNHLVALVDDGSASPQLATVATASANTMFHGVALAPR